MILGILVVIAGGVYLAQFNFNPAVQQMAPVLAADNKGQLPSGFSRKLIDIFTTRPVAIKPFGNL